MKYTKKDVIKIFIQVYNRIVLGDKFVAIKFIFNEDDFYLFEDVLKSQSNKYNAINQYDIMKIKNNNIVKENEIYINITNADLFFTKIQIIVNLYLRYNSSLNNPYLIRDFLTNYLWLKMTPYDFLDIYSFLDLQISFLLNNNIFDIDVFKGGKKISVLNGYDVYAMTEQNLMMWETYQRLFFKIYDKDMINSYELPSIHYGIKNIDDNYTCYIYAIQNMAVLYKQDKKIGRILYKYSNDFIHPSFILSLKLGIEFLIDNGIKEIKIPLLEVLNYSYHEFLSNKIKLDFNLEWSYEYLTEISNEELEDYNKDLKTYNKYVDRVDEISKTKTETLALIVDKVITYFDNIDMSVDDYIINLKVKEKVKKM